MKLIREVEFPEFITHIRMSKKRKAKLDTQGNILNPRSAGTPKYMKINSQNIYSGNMSPLVRQKVVKSMKIHMIPHVLTMEVIPAECFPIIIRGEAHVPLNYGQAKVVGGEFKYPEVGDDYEPNWDIGNLGYLWSKTFDDCLTMSETFDGIPITPIIPDDSVEYVHGTGEMQYFNVPSFEERKLVFKIYSK